MTASTTMYPEAIVVCGPIDLAEDQARAPTVAVEVLSRSTEDHDRGAKWVAYRHLESLQHCLLIAQGERHVEVYSREAGRCVAAGRDAAGPDPPARNRPADLNITPV